MLTDTHLMPTKIKPNEKLLDFYAYWTNYRNMVLGFLVNKLLEPCEIVTKKFQSPGIHIQDMNNTAMDLYKSIGTFLERQTIERLFQLAIVFATDIAGRYNISGVEADYQIVIDKDCFEYIHEGFREIVKELLLQIQSKFIDVLAQRKQYYKGISMLDPSMFLSGDVQDDVFVDLCRAANICSESILDRMRSAVY